MFNLIKPIFTNILESLSPEMVWSIFPSMVRPIIDKYIERDLTQEDRQKIQEYLDIAQKATTVFSWVTEILECLLQGKPVDLVKIEKLRKWEIPETDRQ